MENQFKGTERAKEYSKVKSSYSVFTEAHEADFLAGYNQALEDTKASEMLEMLERCLESEIIDNSTIKFEIRQLIHSATTLLTVLLTVVIIH